MSLPVLRAAIMRKSRESAATQEHFFADNADRILECCSSMARAFDEGAKLLAMGNGGSACDAQHLVVEFAHPIVEKRPALPAWSLVSDAALLSAVVANARQISAVPL